MTEATQLAASAASTDPETGLRAVRALKRVVEALERVQVDNARAKGWSWAAIAHELGVSKQAVHKKYVVTEQFVARKARRKDS